MKQKVARALAALMLACMMIVPVSAAFGDAGSFSGSSSYSSGGSSSSSGGSSYSGGSSHYYSSGSSSGDGASDPFTYVIVAVIVIAIVIVMTRGKGGGGGGGGTVHIDDNFDQSKVRDLGSLKEKDPTFDPDDVVEDVSNWYVRMQNAWTAGDFSPMQPHFSDALYAQFERQLKQLTSADKVNHVDDIAVLSVGIQGWYEEKGQEFLVAKVQTRIKDYTIDKKTGNVVSGDKDKELFMTYRWILSRTAGAHADEGAQTQNCPNCGAAVDVNKSAKCPYCDTVLQSQTHGWVISAIQGLEQRS